MNDHDLDEVEREVRRDLQAVTLALIAAAGDPTSAEYDRLEARQTSLRIALNLIDFKRQWRVIQQAEQGSRGALATLRGGRA